MNEVEKFLRSVKADILERRLWPVLVILVVGLVVAVMKFGGGVSANTPAVTPPPSGPDLAAQGPALSPLPPNSNAAIAETANGVAFQRQAGAHDPFTPLVLPPTGSTGPTGASSSSSSSSSGSGSSGPPSGSGSGSSGGSGGGSGGTSVPTPSVPTPPPSSPTPAPSAPSTPPSRPKSQKLNAQFRFGLIPAGGGSSTGPTGPTGPTGSPVTPVPASDLQPYNNPKVNALLPSNGPVLKLVGTGSGGTTLQFAQQQPLFPSGTGTCVPSPTNCPTIEMAPGDVEIFAFQSPTLGTLYYELTVVSVNGKAASPSSLQGGRRIVVPMPLTHSQQATLNVLRGAIAQATGS
jgi:hypothetical protein